MNYDYHCGVIDAFNEVIKAEVKHMALSHPSTSQEIEELLPFAEKIKNAANAAIRIFNKLIDWIRFHAPLL